jgi:hypothetical protein
VTWGADVMGWVGAGAGSTDRPERRSVARGEARWMALARRMMALTARMRRVELASRSRIRVMSRRARAREAWVAASWWDLWAAAMAARQGWMWGSLSQARRSRGSSERRLMKETMSALVRKRRESLSRSSGERGGSDVGCGMSDVGAGSNAGGGMADVGRRGDSKARCEGGEGGAGGIGAGRLTGAGSDRAVGGAAPLRWIRVAACLGDMRVRIRVLNGLASVVCGICLDLL